MYSLVIKNGRVIDGTGKPGQVMDIACEGSEIVNIAPQINSGARVVIDAAGKIVAPGFIDIQNHSDSYWQLFDNPGLDSLVAQGFTTILVGNCGASLAPILSKDSLLALQKWHDLDGVNTNWQSFSELAELLSTRKFGCNVASLVGYSTIRRGLIGDQVRSLDKNEISAAVKNLQDALSAGAFGLSTGLAYSHELNISELELYEVAQKVAEYNGLLSFHLRHEGKNIQASVEEALDVARHSGVNLKISHFKFKDQQTADEFAAVMSFIEDEYHRGTNVHFDMYPYDTLWQVLFTYLPDWAKEGGRSAWEKHMSDSAQRNKILNYLVESKVNFGEIIISSTSNKLNVVGKKISEIAKNLGTSSEEAVLQIIEKGGSEVMVFDKNLNHFQVKELAFHPLSIIATDGGGFKVHETNVSPLMSAQNKLIHPRCFGTAPKFIRDAIEAKAMPLDQAIWKLTGLPAKKMGLQKRGTLTIGSYADIVIFNPETINEKATLLNPYQYPDGIDYVFVNGYAAVAEGKLTNQQSGRFLKK